MNVAERGSSPIELVLGIALLLIPASLVVMSLVPWVERQIVARVAAREAARVVVLADDPAEAADQVGDLVDQIGGNYGLARDEISVRLTGDLVRGSVVVAEVTVQIPLLQVPGIGSRLGPAPSWTVSHSERIDDYRSLP